MSYTTLYLVPIEGEIETYAEFRNSYRSAFLVWSNMSEKYLQKPLSTIISLNDLNPLQEAWDLWKNPHVLIEDRIVMAATFDKVMVRRTEIPRLIDAILSYITRFDGGNLVDMIDKLRELKDNRVCYAVCWNQTSVSDVWSIYNEETEESRMYDVSRDKNHWFLFDELEKLDDVNP